MVAEIVFVSPSHVKQQFVWSLSYTIIDARPYAAYLAGHLPGAVWMGWEQWCAQAPSYAPQALMQPGYWGQLTACAGENVQTRLRQLGLSNERPVLVYADGPRSMGREARIAWMLLYWGLHSVSLLDGGWSAWLAANGVCETSIPAPIYGNFTIQLQPARRVQLHELKLHLANKTMPLLIDTRSQPEFAGHKHAYQPRMGRLPGSIHLPYTDLFDAAGHFVPQHVYLQRLPEPARNAEQYVACCEVGVRSCLFALLHEAYTGQVVANYDGSVMEWALESSLPLEYDALRIVK